MPKATVDNSAANFEDNLNVLRSVNRVTAMDPATLEYVWARECVGEPARMLWEVEDSMHLTYTQTVRYAACQLGFIGIILTRLRPMERHNRNSGEDCSNAILNQIYGLSGRDLETTKPGGSRPSVLRRLGQVWEVLCDEGQNGPHFERAKLAIHRYMDSLTLPFDILCEEIGDLRFELTVVRHGLLDACRDIDITTEHEPLETFLVALLRRNRRTSTYDDGGLRMGGSLNSHSSALWNRVMGEVPRYRRDLIADLIVKQIEEEVGR